MDSTLAPLSPDPLWTSYAQAYDTLLEVTPYRTMLTEIARAITENVPLLPHGVVHILDAGCGTGNVIHELRRHGVAGTTITGMDITPHMLAYAEEKHAHAGVVFHQGDLNAPLSFAEAQFDAVTCSNVLYATKNPQATLGEFARILKPGGTLVLTTPNATINLGRILKAHARSEKPDAYWERFQNDPQTARELVREALAGSSVSPEMLETVMVANTAIMSSAAMFFFTYNQIETLIRQAGFVVQSISTTYAHQAWLVIANRR